MCVEAQVDIVQRASVSDKPTVNRATADSGLGVLCLLSLKNRFHRQQEGEFRKENY